MIWFRLLLKYGVSMPQRIMAEVTLSVDAATSRFSSRIQPQAFSFPPDKTMIYPSSVIDGLTCLQIEMFFKKT